jgi:hypothetical protein
VKENVSTRECANVHDEPAGVTELPDIQLVVRPKYGVDRQTLEFYVHRAARLSLC